VNYFTLGISITLMETIKDLYISARPARRRRTPARLQLVMTQPSARRASKVGGKKLVDRSESSFMVFVNDV
jgi:hypothetical protein